MLSVSKVLLQSKANIFFCVQIIWLQAKPETSVLLLILESTAYSYLDVLSGVGLRKV